MLVMKFGGTSVGSAERMRGVVRLVGAALAESRVVVVASAVAGVTNLLVEGAQVAADAGETEAASEQFRRVHETVFRELGGDLVPVIREGVGRALEDLATELDNLLQGVALLRECSPSVLAHLSGLGERASCAILSGLFRSSGWPVVDLDARKRLGTFIRARAEAPLHGVRGISFLSDLALLNVTGPGMPGVPGVAARVFGALATRPTSAAACR